MLIQVHERDVLLSEELGPMIRSGWTWHDIDGVRQYSKESGNGWLWVEQMKGKPSGKYAIHGLKIGDEEYKPVIYAENHVAAAKAAMELDQKIATGWAPDNLK